MPSVLLAQANALHLPLKDQSVHMVCTSPPYWGLRLYEGVEPHVWGGETGCHHAWADVLEVNATNHTDKRRWQHTRNGREEEQPIEKRVALLRALVPQGQHCTQCAAWLGCLGLEPLHDCLAWARGEAPCPRCFVCHLRAVFAEVWRCLRDDGVVFLNIGDSYNAAGRDGHGARMGYKQGTNRASANGHDTHRPTAPGLKAKDLCMIPARVALALQADGWTIRSEIVWDKCNPMPESVTDRPTKAHEQVYLFSKQAKYYYDACAIAEPTLGLPALTWDERKAAGEGPRSGFSQNGPGPVGAGAMKNARSVWRIPTEPFSGSHFACFPSALAERCIKVSTSAYGVCGACGAPWQRLVSRQRLLDGHIPVSGTFARPDEPFRIPPNGVGHWRYTTVMTEQSWQPTCRCFYGPGYAEPQPAIVLDPFAGASTTLLAARNLGRHAIGLDLSWDYLHTISRKRLGLTALHEWEHGGQVQTQDYSDLPLFDAGSFSTLPLFGA